MNPNVKFNHKPSLTVGYDENGGMHVLKIGDAQETLDVFKAERDQDNYVRVAWFRKMIHTKARDTSGRGKETVSIDFSKYDGDAGKALRKKEEAEAKAAKAAAAKAAATVIIPTDSEAAPKPKRKPKK